MNGQTIIFILAIIGAIVVLGWVLKFALAVMGPLIVIGLAVIVYLVLTKKKGGSR